MEGIQTFKGSWPWPWPWPWIRPTAYPRASLIDLYLYTKFHSNRRNFLWTDGRTDGRTFSPSNIIRSTFGSRPKNEFWNVWRPRLKSQNFCGHCRDQYRMHMSDHKCCRWKDLTVYNETWRTQGALPHCFTTLLQRFLLRFLSADTIPRPQLMWSMLPVIRLTHNRSLYLVRWLPRLALATVELSVEQMFGDAISNFWRTWPHQWNRHSTLSYQLMWSMRHRQRIWNLLSVKM